MTQLQGDGSGAWINHDANLSAIASDALSGMQPQNELYISLPVDTVVKFRVFHTEQELDNAINSINKKWLQIGDYRRYFTSSGALANPVTLRL